MLSSQGQSNHPRGDHDKDIVTCTRFWANDHEDLVKLEAFISRTEEYSKRIIIAINVDEDMANTVTYFSSKKPVADVEFLNISPWGGVTHSLNMLLHYVTRKSFVNVEYVLFQSPEVIASKQDVSQLLNEMTSKDRHVLVAGRALHGHRTYNLRGDQLRRELRADNVPWNTFAIWNIKFLTLTGFPAVADQVEPPGMEEAAAIALQQSLYGEKNRIALLVHSKELQWDTTFTSGRLMQHVRKMQSKANRVEEILKLLGLNTSAGRPQVRVCLGGNLLDQCDRANDASSKS